jgi:hypothetical protein
LKSKTEETEAWRSRSLKKLKMSRSRRYMKPKIYEVELKKTKIEEIEDWRSRRIKEVKVWKSRRLKKSKIERSRRFKVWRLNTSLQLELSLGGYWHGYVLRVPTD